VRPSPGAVSIAFAIFLILELGLPYTGLLKVSPAARQEGDRELGQVGVARGSYRPPFLRCCGRAMRLTRHAPGEADALVQQISLRAGKRRRYWPKLSCAPFSRRGPFYAAR
jgi:hypothetical protein